MINNPFAPKTGGVFTITELDSGGVIYYGFPSNASAGEFVHSAYYLGNGPSPNVRTESGKTVPYNEFGGREKNCEFVMPAENVVVV
jgi:hypothetical protein